MTDITPLRDFVTTVSRLVDGEPKDETSLLDAIRPALARLIAADRWLDEHYTRPHPQYYQQYLLYADPLDRWSVVSFVWGPGQKTPVHDHRVWGLIGVLQGGEVSTSFEPGPGGALVATGEERLQPGDIAAVSPTIGDIHEVANAYDDRVSISIHVYGGNIGKVERAVYDPATAAEKQFISGYSNDAIPNLWRRNAAN